MYVWPELTIVSLFFCSFLCTFSLRPFVFVSLFPWGGWSWWTLIIISLWSESSNISALITSWNPCYPIWIRNVCFSPGKFLLSKFCCLKSFFSFPPLIWKNLPSEQLWIFVMSWPGLVLFLFHICLSDSNLVACLAGDCTIDEPETEPIYPINVFEFLWIRCSD